MSLDFKDVSQKTRVAGIVKWVCGVTSFKR